MAALISRFLSVSCKRLAHAGPLLDSAVAENRTRTARSRLQLSNHSEPLFHWRLCLHISFLPHYHITLYHKRGGVTWLKWAKRPRHAMRQLLQKIINTAAVISRRPILGLLTVNKQCGKIQKSETKRNLMEKWSCPISLQFFFSPKSPLSVFLLICDSVTGAINFRILLIFIQLCAQRKRFNPTPYRNYFMTLMEQLCRQVQIVITSINCHMHIIRKNTELFYADLLLQMTA